MKYYLKWNNQLKYAFLSNQTIALFCFVLFVWVRLSDAQEGFDFLDLLKHKKEEKKEEPPKPPKKYEYHSKISHGGYHHPHHDDDDDDDDDHWGKPKYKPIFKHDHYEDNWWTTTTTEKPTTKKSIIPKELSDIVNGENMNFVSELMPQIPAVWFNLQIKPPRTCLPTTFK